MVVAGGSGDLTVPPETSLEHQKASEAQESWLFLHHLSPGRGFGTFTLLLKNTHLAGHAWGHPFTHLFRVLGGDSSAQRMARRTPVLPEPPKHQPASTASLYTLGFNFQGQLKITQCFYFRYKVPAASHRCLSFF